MEYRPVLPNADVKGSFIKFLTELFLFTEILTRSAFHLMLNACVTIEHDPGAFS